MKNKMSTPEGAPTNQSNITPIRKITQEDVILDYWYNTGEEIGQLEAITELGIGHLSSLISKMIHKLGIKGIRKIPTTSSSGAHYTAYYMAKEDVKEAKKHLKEIRGY